MLANNEHPVGTTAQQYKCIYSKTFTGNRIDKQQQPYHNISKRKQTVRGEYRNKLVAWLKWKKYDFKSIKNTIKQTTEMHL